MPVRDVVKLIYKVGMTIITLTLVGLAYLAWRDATPANQLLLIAGILGVLALISGLSITKLDDRDKRAATYRSLLDDVRKHAKASVRFAEPGMADGATRLGGISVSFAEPEVHHVGATAVAEAKAMDMAGAPIDEICRTIDPGHDQHDEVHQEAFRRIVRAMIAEA